MFEVHYLTAVEGQYKGRTWPVDAEGLLLGRSVGCDISLEDRSVSRRHCRLVLREGVVVLEELGSLNPTLVNGEPATGRALSAGDHIALGGSLFLLATCVEASSHADSPQPAEDTFPVLSDAKPIYLDTDPKTLWLRERPRTVHDLIYLYDTVQYLVEAKNREDFMARLEARLSERFGSLELWIARVHEDNELGLICTPASSDPSRIPLEAIRASLQSGQGLLMPSTHREEGRRIRNVTLVAPMVFGGETTAVMAIRTVPAPESSGTAGLALLMLLARSLAPVIQARDHADRLRLENERLRAKAGESSSMLGTSSAIVQVRKALETAARSTLNVLITGETGTGKELAARMLHARSSRYNLPLVVVNCAAIPKDLFESELFGHAEGAFTGANRSAPGLLEKADGGTLFLDEVGDLSLENQARILRVVEDGTYRSVGGREERRVDMRIVAATNKDLPEAIRRGAFREDLYHRLNGFEILLPPLSERASDIPLLAEHFFRLAAGQAKHPLRGIGPEAVKHLQQRPWPGNVRELRNCVYRAVTKAVGETVSLEDVLGPLPVVAAALSTAEPGVVSLAEIEKRHIESILRRCDGNVGEAARILGIGRSTLYRMLTEHRIVL